jgi:hypothetical protein
VNWWWLHGVEGYVYIGGLWQWESVWGSNENVDRWIGEPATLREAGRDQSCRAGRQEMVYARWVKLWARFFDCSSLRPSKTANWHVTSASL